MTKSIAYCTLIVAAGVAVALAAYAPALLSDENSFLRRFVNHEFLNVLGVVLAITLASSAQLHLALNQIEERFRKPGAMAKTRRGVHSAAHWLIGLFGIGVLIVVVKPLVATALWSQSLLNSAALFVLLWNVLMVIAMVQTVFRTPAIIDGEEGE